ncbi:MAG TPA: hypothetical protein VMU18_03260 [Rhodoblastus sp.]|nr:hypothetical protein [Rhodoblastus sp.]
MKPVPFAQYLARQQQGAPPTEGPAWPPRAKPAAAEPPRRSPLLRQVEKPAADPAHDLKRRLEQDHLKAYDEGREAAHKEYEEERRQLRAQLADEVARARAQWTEQEAARLVEEHRAAFADFEQSCARTVAQILRPFLAQQSIARVTEALVENLEALFASRVLSTFEISGPPDLLAALEAKFAAQGAKLEFRPDESIDVRVRVGDTIIESQLAPWLQALGALSRGGADE